MHKYLFIISFSTALFVSCGKQGDQSLAVVNDHIISLESFIPKYNQFLNVTSQKDNLANRNLFLNSLIDEWLIVDYAKETSLVDDPNVMREKQCIYDQILLNHFFDNQIAPRTKATESDLRRLFAWSKMSLHVRHLYAKDLNTINGIHAELRSGANWNALAQTCFHDSLLKNNGGDLGWINMGEMDPAFEVVAYTLKDDEISTPVKTKYGYSIIQVLERERDIFLTEQDFQLEKDYLLMMAIQYKKYPAIRAFTDSVEAEMDIVFSHDKLKELFDAIISGNESNKMFSRMPLVHFNNEHFWTVQEVYNKLISLSPRQFNHITSIENLNSIINGLVIRELFLQEAEKLKLQKTPSFSDTYSQKYNNYLINLCLKNLYEAIPFDENDRSQKIKTAYLNLRNDLAGKSIIKIDNMAVKTFVFNQQSSS